MLSICGRYCYQLMDNSDQPVCFRLVIGRCIAYLARPVCHSLVISFQLAVPGIAIHRPTRRLFPLVDTCFPVILRGRSGCYYIYRPTYSISFLAGTFVPCHTCSPAGPRHASHTLGRQVFGVPSTCWNTYEYLLGDSWLATLLWSILCLSLITSFSKDGT